jgi:hypothetical protein
MGKRDRAERFVMWMFVGYAVCLIAWYVVKLLEVTR